MFWWVDTYRNVPAPNFDQYGSLTHWALVAIMQLTLFSVPAFLFVSGYFVAYAGRGTRASLTWKVIRVRITRLLIPYFIWSVLFFIADLLQGIVYTPIEYATKLVVGNADGYKVFFYVPLLCQFYLLSPFLTRLARKNWQLLVAVAAIVQFGLVVVGYLNVFDVPIPGRAEIQRFTPVWTFPVWLLYYVLGIVAGMHAAPICRWLERWKWGLFAVLLVTIGLVVIEPELVCGATGKAWARGPFLISSNLYSIAFVACFLAIDQRYLPFRRLFNQAAGKTYGIYLQHAKVLEFSSRLIRRLSPQILAIQPVFVPLLIIAGVGLPWLFMSVVAKSPARGMHRYLFG